MERVLLWRERYAGYYSTGPYFLSKLIVDLIPFRIMPPILYSSVAYWMVGLQPDFSRFLIFTGMLILTNMLAGSSVMIISAMSADVGQANLVGVLYFIYTLLFGGLLMNSDGNNESTQSLGGLQTFSFVNYAFAVNTLYDESIYANWHYMIIHSSLSNSCYSMMMI